MLALLVTLSLAQNPPPPPPSYSPAQEREITIKALREEVEELKDQKSGIGYVFPTLCIGAGAALIATGLLVRVDASWFRPTMLIGGTAIATLSTLWLIIRIARSISLGNQIGDKEDQIRKLEDQRLQARLMVWL